MSLFINKHLATILIVQGVMAWIPYVYLKYMGYENVGAMPFLIWHLLGVIPGAWIGGRGFIVGRVKKALRGED